MPDRPAAAAPMTHHRRPMLLTGLGVLLGLLSAAATGGSFIFSKVIQQDLSTLAFVTWWFGLSGVYGLIGHALLRRTQTDTAATHRPVTRHTWRLLIMIAVLNTLRGLTHHGAIALGDPALVSFLSRFTTVFVLALSVVLLHERLSRSGLLGAALVIAGALVINYSSTAITLPVFVLALVDALAEASDVIVAKVAGQVAAPSLMLAARGLGTALLAGALMIVLGQWQFPAAQVWPILLIGAVIGPFGGFFARYQGLRYLSAWMMGVLVAMQPLFTTLYSALFLDSLPGPQALLGGFVLLAGVLLILSQLARSARQQAE